VQGVLSCLNSFSGAVFLTVGLTHLLPHVAEFEANANLGTAYPVGFAIVAGGFILVLFVEQVLFNVHGDMPERPDDEKLQDVPLLERTKRVARFFQEPLITELAVGLHAMLESITLGVAVRFSACCVCLHAPCANEDSSALKHMK
jgi:hypothetical protein